MTNWNKRKRLEATIAGEKTDRVPVALWRHWPGDDQDAAALATSLIKWQNDYDWDLVKVSPASSFSVTGYGLTDRWVGHIEGTREYVHQPIKTAKDWAKLTPLDPSQGQLAAQLETLRLLGEGLAAGIPYIATIFSPLSQAKYLAGNEKMIGCLRNHPQVMHKALQTLTESTLRFIEGAKKRGIAGIYYAIQHARYTQLTADEYRTFGRYYDEQILAAVSDLWLNMLHIHSTEIMFSEVADYPVQFINWHDRDTEVSLADGLSKIEGAASGGVSQWTLHQEMPAGALAEARDAIQQTRGRRLLLGTGCVTMVTTPTRNIRALRNFVDSV